MIVLYMCTVETCMATEDDVLMASGPGGKHMALYEVCNCYYCYYSHYYYYYYYPSTTTLHYIRLLHKIYYVYVYEMFYIVTSLLLCPRPP